MMFDCTLEGRKLRWLSFGLLILIISQTAIFLGLISGWRMRYSSQLETNNLCMACDALEPTVYHAKKEIDMLRQSHNSNECCGTIHNVIQLLFKKEMVLQYYETSTASSSEIGELFINNCELENLKTPKAKLVGVVGSVPSISVEGHSKLLWNTDRRTFTANNCNHLEPDGEILIKKPGYYKVLSTLNVNATGTNTSLQTFSHQVNLVANRLVTTDVLLQRTTSINESNHGVFTSFISAVFMLQTYDRIAVSVSHEEYLARNCSADNLVAYFTYNF